MISLHSNAGLPSPFYNFSALIYSVPGKAGDELPWMTAVHTAKVKFSSNIYLGQAIAQLRGIWHALCWQGARKLWQPRAQCCHL